MLTWPTLINIFFHCTHLLPKLFSRIWASDTAFCSVLTMHFPYLIYLALMQSLLNSLIVCSLWILIPCSRPSLRFVPLSSKQRRQSHWSIHLQRAQKGFYHSALKSLAVAKLIFAMIPNSIQNFPSAGLLLIVISLQEGWVHGFTSVGLSCLCVVSEQCNNKTIF